ncbi:hypothetical protein BBK82_21745 [Lentzea guizhouensis]|uniref:OmpA-like domain-containing protein n=1 Tax=Lentzea guizhouensis TaxID=1586287 RepID=A0A1B2HKP9_9PSEU|nr:OmpA family protein [Lentzea guizhouensis]ANZ38297.1 hypothetical protein BBK82_21745 [Lentzea guizhouensis]
MNRLLAALAVAVLVPITACESETPIAAPNFTPCTVSHDQPLAIAVGARANVPNPEPPEAVNDLMTGVARAHQPITLVRVDGKPEYVFTEPAPPRGDNPQTEAEAVQGYLDQVTAAFGEKIRAQVAEVNVLRALTISAQKVGPGGTIVLMDSGLQTTAPLRFGADEVLTADPAEVARFLAEEKQLPDLLGRSVVLVGLGLTADPQPQLDPRWENNVFDIWKAVVEAAGGCAAKVLHGSTSAAAVDSPTVAVVQPPKPKEPKTCGTVELGEADNISFKPDSAEFRDPAAARETLQRLADTMRAKKQKADLMGTTASVGPPAGRVELSARRADAVKSVLVDLGIPGDTITTRGVGTNWPGHVTDTGPGGALLPGPAARNRKVVATLTCLEQ